MQMAFGTGGRHIKQPPVLQTLFFAVELFNPGIDRIAVIPRRVDRRQQQFSASICIRLLGPQEQFFVVAARRPGKAGHDHHIKLKPLGFVDGHDLQAVVGIEIGQGIQLIKAGFEGRAIRQGPGIFMFVEIAEIGFRILEIGFLLHAGRTA